VSFRRDADIYKTERFDRTEVHSMLPAGSKSWGRSIHGLRMTARASCVSPCGDPGGYFEAVSSLAYSQTYHSLQQDVQNLVTLHPSESGTAGRPAGDTGPLLRSTIVLLHTAWENYVEQVSIEGLEAVLTWAGSDDGKLHKAMRQKLGALKDPWALAGSGWQTQARTAVREEAGRLNTPNVANSEALLELALGPPQALHDVSWQGIRKARVLDRIDTFVHEIRGEIVHKGTVPGPLNKGGVESWINFFESLVPRVDDKLSSHLATVTGTAPW